MRERGARRVSGPVIRHARREDLGAIVDILNHWIANHHATFDTEPWSAEDKQAWFAGFGEHGPHRCLVAERDGDILGYAHSTRFRPKRGYDTTVETTVYLNPDACGKGVGRALLESLLGQLEGLGLHRALAIIAQPNPASNRLHESLGFKHVGTTSEVGMKFGRYWTTWWFERPL